MTKKTPFYLISGLHSELVQAALESAVAQNLSNSGITVRRDNDKPNTIIVAAKAEIARFIVVDKTPMDSNILFFEPPSEKLSQDINEVIMDFKNTNADFVVPKFDDVFVMDKKQRKLHHKKNMERIIGNRYVNAQYNQIKKIMHNIRTRNR